MYNQFRSLDGSDYAAKALEQAVTVIDRRVA